MHGDILTNKCATDKLFIIGYDETAGDACWFRVLMIKQGL